MNTDSRDTIAKPNRLLATKTVRLEKEDLNIRYAELGDPAKPTVLLLHGVPENLQAWYAAAPLLAEKYHVLAVDWPGFGGSDPLTSPEDYTSRRFAEVVRRLHGLASHPSSEPGGHRHCPSPFATGRPRAPEPRL